MTWPFSEERLLQRSPWSFTLPPPTPILPTPPRPRLPRVTAGAARGRGGSAPPSLRYGRAHRPRPARQRRCCPELPDAPNIKGGRDVLINILTPQANIC